MIYNVALNDYGKECKSCTICIVLLITIFVTIIAIISISISNFLFYLFFYFFRFIFVGLRKKNISVECNNLAATYVKMLYYNKIKVSERVDIFKSNKLKECMICHYWYFLDNNCKYEPEVCNGCHNISMMVYD